MNDRVHVLPLNDIQIHEEEGEHCNCNPRVESVGESRLVIHNAFDGREMGESIDSLIQYLGRTQ